MIRWQDVVERSTTLVESKAPEFQEKGGFKTQLRRLAFSYGIDRIEFREMDGPAILVRRPGDGKTIVLNQADSKVRHRFSIAHEIAHLVLDPILGSRAIHRRKLSRGQDPEGRRIEYLCDALAAAILMPKKTIQDFVNNANGSASCLPKVAKCFDTSFEAAARRFVAIHPGKCALVIWKASQEGRPVYVRNTVTSNSMGRCLVKFANERESVVLKTREIASIGPDELIETQENVEITRGYGYRASTTSSKDVPTETLSHGHHPYRTSYSVLHFGP